MPTPVQTVLIPDLEHELAQRLRGLEGDDRLSLPSTRPGCFG